MRYVHKVLGKTSGRSVSFTYTLDESSFKDFEVAERLLGIKFEGQLEVDIEADVAAGIPGGRHMPSEGPEVEALEISFTKDGGKVVKIPEKLLDPRTVRGIEDKAVDLADYGDL